MGDESRQDEGVPSSFVQLLKRLISARFKSRRAFIRVADPRAEEDVAQAYLTQVLRDKKPKPPPLDRVGDWAEALELNGENRRRFEALAVLAHLPAEVRPQFESWYDEHQRLKADYAELLSEVRRVAEK